MNKNIYIVKHSDLIGEISDFPIEVVQKMVERQYEQKGFCDVSVFQKNKIDGLRGFGWLNTIERGVFWSTVISGHRWDIFFERYPALRHKCTFTVVNGDGSYKADVLKMQKYSQIKRKFAYKNKPGDIYYIDVDRHGDNQVRFALANSSLAKEVVAKGVKFGDVAMTVSTEEKSDITAKSEEPSDANFLVPPPTNPSLRDAIIMLETEMIHPWAF